MWPTLVAYPPPAKNPSHLQQRNVALGVVHEGDEGQRQVGQQSGPPHLVGERVRHDRRVGAGQRGVPRPPQRVRDDDVGARFEEQGGGQEGGPLVGHVAKHGVEKHGVDRPRVRRQGFHVTQPGADATAVAERGRGRAVVGREAGEHGGRDVDREVVGHAPRRQVRNQTPRPGPHVQHARVRAQAGHGGDGRGEALEARCGGVGVAAGFARGGRLLPPPLLPPPPRAAAPRQTGPAG